MGCLSAAKRHGSTYTAPIASRDLSADEQAVAATLMVSRSFDEPVFEKLTLRQISARTGLTEERSERALVKFEELDLIRRGTDAQTREEFFSAVQPEVQGVGLRLP
ncbi:MAG: hypothetical protein JWO14_142 [Solirubrobacterales bacterium]|nr:hypothetical protein [Solirubrobacterales bacterium]